MCTRSVSLSLQAPHHPARWHAPPLASLLRGWILLLSSKQNSAVTLMCLRAMTLFVQDPRAVTCRGDFNVHHFESLLRREPRSIHSPDMYGAMTRIEPGRNNLRSQEAKRSGSPGSARRENPAQGTRGSNPGLPHCRQILFCLSHQRSPLYSSYPSIKNKLEKKKNDSS